MGPLSSGKKAKIIFLFIVCFSQLTAAMTKVGYNAVEIGDKFDTIEGCAGRPYRICSKGGETYEYEYVEKIVFTDKTNVTVNHYYFIVSNGIIVGKRFKIERSPAYNMIYQEDPNIYSY